MKMTLIPYLTYKSAESDKHNRYEMVAIHTNGFPAGLVHIDTFLSKMMTIGRNVSTVRFTSAAKQSKLS